MGKYSVGSDNKNLQRIANELAEANRLKRLELKHKWPSLKGHTRKELEDKA